MTTVCMGMTYKTGGHNPDLPFENLDYYIEATKENETWTMTTKSGDGTVTETHQATPDEIDGINQRLNPSAERKMTPEELARMPLPEAATYPELASLLAQAQHMQVVLDGFLKAKVGEETA